MDMVKSFAPWIVFVVGADLVDWRLGVVGGALTLVWVMATSRPRLALLNVAMLVFFVVIGVVAFASPDSSLEPWVGTMSMAWLAVVSLGSLAVHHPFTVDLAGDVDPEIRKTKLFYDINARITVAWAACFAVIAVAAVVGSALDVPGLQSVVTVLGLIWAIKFTKSYPDRAVAAAGVRGGPT